MHQVALHVEGADLDGGVVEFERGLVGDAVGIDVALPVVEHVGCGRRARLVQRGVFRHRSRNPLLDIVAVEIEAGLDIRRDLVAEIGEAAIQRAVAVLAKAVLLPARSR